MRSITEKEWRRYVERLARIDETAAKRMQAWITANGTEDLDRLIDFAFGDATKYGEAAAALACEMYDAVAEAQGARVPPAEPAETATYDETAKAVRGTLRNLQNTVAATVGRLVKQAGADTMLKNAARDRAEFAWIPWGTETCAFCIALASRGWQEMSPAAAKGSHAEHIHANCFCEYAVRFDGHSTVAGYDPDRYLDMYYAAGGSDSDERIRNLRRELEAPRREEINAQKRAAYARRKEALTGAVGSGIVDIGVNAKITDRGVVLNPMEKVDYQRMTEGLRKHGIQVVTAVDGDDLRYMLALGAEGTYSNGQITHIGAIPSRGTLFEEIIHSTQARLYGELSSTDTIELCAREIEANRKLLRYQNAYRLDALDVSDIQNNLAKWESAFEKQTGVKYDESDYRPDV